MAMSNDWIQCPCEAECAKKIINFHEANDRLSSNDGRSTALRAMSFFLDFLHEPVYHIRPADAGSRCFRQFNPLP